MLQGENEKLRFLRTAQRVIFERDCKEGRSARPGAAPLPCGFMVAAADGEPEQICERCTPRGFSSDGSVILLQKYDQTDPDKSRIVALDLRDENGAGFPESSGRTALSSLLLLG